MLLKELFQCSDYPEAVTKKVKNLSKKTLHLKGPVIST